MDGQSKPEDLNRRTTREEGHISIRRCQLIEQWMGAQMAGLLGVGGGKQTITAKTDTFETVLVGIRMIGMLSWLSLRVQNTKISRRMSLTVCAVLLQEVH